MLQFNLSPIFLITFLKYDLSIKMWISVLSHLHFFVLVGDIFAGWSKIKYIRQPLWNKKARDGITDDAYQSTFSVSWRRHLDVRFHLCASLCLYPSD